MIKRLILFLVLILAFITFYEYIPYEIYSKAPILLTLLFSIITGALVLLCLVNATTFIELKNIYHKTTHLWSLWTIFITVSTLSIVGSFFVYYLNYIDRTKNEFKYNSVQTEGILLDKWTEEITKKFETRKFVHIKVKYKVENKDVISEHITIGKSEEEIPNKGDSLLVFYSKMNPNIFETLWEHEITNYDRQKDPEQIRRRKLIDSLVLNK